MKYSPSLYIKALPAAVLLISTQTQAADFFIADFETEKTFNALNAANVFQLPPIFDDNLTDGGFFEVTDSASFGGSSSMVFNYNGNNGVCNTCGTYLQLRHIEGHDGANNYTVAGRLNSEWRNGDPIEDRYEAINLRNLDDPDSSKADDGPRATKGRVVFNANNGYSKWRITDIVDEVATNDRLNLTMIAPPIDGSTAEFNAGDQIRIARICGVDGSVGIGQVDRMTDCDGGISWFGTDSTVDALWAQDNRQPFYRRVYLKHAISNKQVHTKLRYMEFGMNPGNHDGLGGIDADDYYYKAPGAQLPTVDKRAIVVYVESLPDDPDGIIRPVLANLHKLHPVHWNGGSIKDNPVDLIYKTKFADVNTPRNMARDQTLERGKWYYMEEEIIPSTDDTTADGTYRIWINEAGSEPATDCDPAEALLEVNGLIIPPIARMSFWGNHQNSEQRVGKFYIDDVAMTTDTCNGKVTYGASSDDTVKPPAAP